MKINKILEKLFYIGAIGISIVLLFFFITCVWIGHEAKTLCQDAKREYNKKDCVDALISQLDDSHRGFRARNDAIWGLGQFGGTKALPVLQKYYTGKIPDREPLDDMISQYELKKAIALAKGGSNITAWIWR
jgi:hypothetical protein